MIAFVPGISAVHRANNQHKSLQRGNSTSSTYSLSLTGVIGGHPQVCVRGWGSTEPVTQPPPNPQKPQPPICEWGLMGLTCDSYQGVLPDKISTRYSFGTNQPVEPLIATGHRGG